MQHSFLDKLIGASFAAGIRGVKQGPDGAQSGWVFRHFLWMGPPIPGCGLFLAPLSTHWPGSRGLPHSASMHRSLLASAPVLSETLTSCQAGGVAHSRQCSKLLEASAAIMLEPLAWEPLNMTWLVFGGEWGFLQGWMGPGPLHIWQNAIVGGGWRQTSTREVPPSVSSLNRAACLRRGRCLLPLPCESSLGVDRGGGQDRQGTQRPNT